MAKEKFGSVRRFGARYGRRVRQKLGMIEKHTKTRQKCPYCNSYSVKRIAVGIYVCKKCNSKFTGRAYILEKPKKRQEAKEEDINIDEIEKKSQRKKATKQRLKEEKIKPEESKDQENIEDNKPEDSENDNLGEDDKNNQAE